MSNIPRERGTSSLGVPASKSLMITKIQIMEPKIMVINSLGLISRVENNSPRNRTKGVHEL
jgi:hypothetical protein